MQGKPTWCWSKEEQHKQCMVRKFQTQHLNEIQGQKITEYTGYKNKNKHATSALQQVIEITLHLEDK